MDKSEKKKEKYKYKIAKKEAKRKKKELKKNAVIQNDRKHSKLILFAELIKGIIYLILSISLIVSLILGEKGVIITLDDIINNLFFANTGKIILFIVALGLLFYGLKQLKILK